MEPSLDNFLEGVRSRSPHEPEFYQAVEELARSVWPIVSDDHRYTDARILERLSEPERTISFRVTWEDDHGRVHVNRGYRVQFSSSLGPYKGGLRFHPSVNLSILKFLGFEQVFKNALTGLPLGGGKGGSDFDPKGKSDEEIMRFCQAFMLELFRHIGPNTDIPAGDIGVGGREIGYLFGMYKKLANEFTGVLTGKGPSWGGSLLRPEATGYGVVYFAEEMLSREGESVKGKTCLVSGSGNVAQSTVLKLIESGAKVVTMSDSSGFIHDSQGIDRKKLAFVMELKNSKYGRIKEYTKKFPRAKFYTGKTPWVISGHLAFPCATQNEITKEDAEKLISNGCWAVIEGANMPSTKEAVEIFTKKGILFAPSKAANAGGVAVSGLEMSQNSVRLAWTREEVDSRLRVIMRNIHEQCVDYGKKKNGKVNLANGANIAGFVRVANAMLDQGIL